MIALRICMMSEKTPALLLLFVTAIPVIEKYGETNLLW